MGGTNQQNSGGLRMHLNSGEVHVHDDARSLKYSAEKGVFKSGVNVALKELEKTDGIIPIKGKTSVDFCVGRHNDKVFTFLRDNKNALPDLQTFLKGC